MAGQPTATVLVVDNDLLLLEIFTEALSLIGYETIACSNDAQGIDELHKLTPALLVLGPGPSGLPGRDVLQVIGDDPRLRELPVLICSTSPRRFEDPPVRHCPRAWTTIAKPFDLDAFLQTVSFLIQQEPAKTSATAFACRGS
jgi:DNA-binding response OmpR family regulator